MRAFLVLAIATLLPAAALAADDSLLLLEGRDGARPFQQASHLKNRKRLDEAGAALTEAERKHGPHPDIYAMRAEIAISQARLDDAGRAVDAALRLDPAHRTGTLLLGRLQAMRGDRKAAWRTLDRLTRLCPFGCAQEQELRAWFAAQRW